MGLTNRSIPWENLQMLPVAGRALPLLGHGEAPKQKPGAGRSLGCPEGQAEQTPGDTIVPGGLEMVLGTVLTMPEDLAPWGVASCS